MCPCTHAMAPIWKSENNLQKLVLFLYNVGPGMKLKTVET